MSRIDSLFSDAVPLACRASCRDKERRTKMEASDDGFIEDLHLMSLSKIEGDEDFSLSTAPRLRLQLSYRLCRLHGRQVGMKI